MRSSSDISRAGWRIRLVIQIVQTFSEPALLFSSAFLSLLIISGLIPTPLASDAPKTLGKPLGRRGDPTKAQEWGSFGSLTAMSTGLTPQGRLLSVPSRLWKILGQRGRVWGLRRHTDLHWNRSLSVSPASCLYDEGHGCS